MRDYERIQIFSSLFFLVSLSMNKTRTGSFLCYGKIFLYSDDKIASHSSPPTSLVRARARILHIIEHNFVNLDSHWTVKSRSNFRHLFYGSSWLWLYSIYLEFGWTKGENNEKIFLWKIIKISKKKGKKKQRTKAFYAFMQKGEKNML